MDGVSAPGELGRVTALPKQMVVDSSVQAIYPNPRPSASIARGGILQRLVSNAQLGCVAAIVLANFLFAGQSGSLSSGLLFHGVLIICGFAILVNHWSRRQETSGASTLVGVLTERSVQIATLVSVATMVAIEFTGVPWELLWPARTFVLLLIVGCGGAAFLAFANWLARDTVARCVVVFGDGKPAFQLAEQVRLKMPRTKVCLYPTSQLAAPTELMQTSTAGPCHADSKLVELGPDVAIISSEVSDHKAIASMTSQLAPLPIDVLIHTPQSGRFGLGPMVTFAAMPFIRLYPKPLGAYQRVMKRALDIAMSSVLLALLSPVLLAVALLIKFDSRGPVLFRQPRAGLGGSHFTIFKFRSMHTEATDLLADRATVENDPRLTKVGAWIRKCSIDELPQLFNVLFGSMSLVGPRPHAMNGYRFCRLVGNYHARHRVRPGITGLAQVLGWRGPTDTRVKVEQRVANDLYYISNWSLTQDLIIIGRTIFAIWGKNAF
jgi:exopolysaccharide biosynthesis polyprenyl glycosylphosphotransferase